MQHKSSAFFHKMINRLIFYQSSNVIQAKDKASFLNKFSQTYSKVYFTFEEKFQTLHEIGRFPYHVKFF